MAAVSRFPGSMDLWWVWKDGSIQGAKWEEGVEWQQYELAPANSTFITNQSITAISRHRSILEIWWIGKDGSIQEAKWEEGAEWERYEVAPAGSANTVPVGGSIKALSRFPGHKELWWVGNNDSVQGAKWEEGSQWQRYEVAPANSAYGNIAAISRSSSSIDLFWIGNNRSVQGAKWEEDAPQWQRYEVVAGQTYGLKYSCDCTRSLDHPCILDWR